MHKVKSQACPCQSSEQDDTFYTFFEYERWNEDIQELECEVGPLSQDYVLEVATVTGLLRTSRGLLLRITCFLNSDI